MAGNSRSAFLETLSAETEKTSPMRNRIRLFMLVVFVSFMFAGGLLAQSKTQDGVEVTLSSVERGGRNKDSYKFRYKITNNDRLAVFLPRRGLGKPNGIDTLQIEVLLPDGKWQVLPDHHEIAPQMSSPVKIEPGQTYDDEFSVDKEYHVSAWDSYPRPPYDIAVRGEMRIRLGYFLGEADWQTYVSQHNAKGKSAAPQSSKISVQKFASSESIALPEDTQ